MYKYNFFINVVMQKCKNEEKQKIFISRRRKKVDKYKCRNVGKKKCRNVEMLKCINVEVQKFRSVKKQKKIRRRKKRRKKKHLGNQGNLHQSGKSKQIRKI